MISNPQGATLEDFDHLIKLIREYPYCQNYRILAAKVASDNLFQEQREMTHFAALYATNRTRLKKLLDNSLNLGELPITYNQNTEPDKKTETKPKLPVQNNNADDKPVSQAESIKRMLQDSIIEEFISKNPKISPLQPKRLRNDHPNEDLSCPCAKPPSEFVSENMAKILLKQGKTKEAISMYKKLALKYPKKKNYYKEIIKQIS
ncbi:MAG: hypothetical protein MI784_02660 [Cytophagales bacterium]|nr:hypothetical protein [Cytophagales bacterium]